MLHIRVGILLFVLMVQYEVATSITRKTSSLSNFEREHHIYKDQHPVHTTIAVQNPTGSFKVKAPTKRHAGASGSAHIGWLKWKAYKKRRNRNRNQRHRPASKPNRFFERTPPNNYHQHRDRPKKVFYNDDDYPRRDEQYYRKEKPQNIRMQKVPSKHTIKYVDQPRPVKKQRTVIKIHKPWKKLIPWVTARPGKIPDEFSLEEPLPELGGSPPSYPTRPEIPNNYQNIDQNVPYKYESIPDYNSYASDLTSLEDENYLKQSSLEFGTLASASDVLPYNKYSPIVENMRDYNWYDYNKDIYSFSTEPSLANVFTENEQYETIPITEYYQQNYNTPEPVSVLKEPISSIEDLAIAYSDTVSDVIKLDETLNQHENMPITEYKQQNHSLLSESVLQEPVNITYPPTLNLKVISAHQMDGILENRDKKIVENLFLPFKKESGFSSKRNITKYFKPFIRIDTENDKNSSVFNGHTYNIHSQKEFNIGEDLGEHIVTITPDKKRRENDGPDKVYSTTTRDTDLRRNQDAVNQQNALRRRRIVKKGGIRKTDQDIKEAILTNIMFVDDNIH
ncbi:hypothetical protein CBL_11275 [Carabus blaptoides fortunei]